MFSNLRKDNLRSGNFWMGEVSDLNGRLHTLSGIWAMSEDKAAIAFDKIATDWSTFDAPSDEVMEASTNALLADIAVWGSE